MEPDPFNFGDLFSKEFQFPTIESHDFDQLTATEQRGETTISSEPFSIDNLLATITGDKITSQEGVTKIVSFDII